MENIKKYLDLLAENELLTSYDLFDKEETLVEHLTYASGDAKAGTLFICKGNAFKEEYLVDALSKGAIAYISEQKYEVENPYILVSDIRKAMPLLAKMFYENPDEKMTLVGITGTKGKTTTSYYIKAILDEYLEAENKPAAGIIASIDTYDGVSTQESTITTPESFEIFRHLNNATTCDIEQMIMEVSSQALKYDRVKDIVFDVGIFLNISDDHISPIEHTDFEDYFSAKLRIFKQTKTACVNIDSDYPERIMEEAKAAEKIVTFGTKSTPDILGSNIRVENGVVSFDVSCKDFSEHFRLAMPGIFNVENALAAIAATNEIGVPVRYMVDALSKATVKGRMEMYESEDGNIRALVDYAHNRLSYEKLYESVLAEHPEYKIVTIFGCPGGKAQNRRKELGEISGKFSHKVFLVAEDPNMEPPAEISKEISKYVEKTGCPYECIDDREQAIRKAIGEATGKTIFLVLGKGTEEEQKVNGKYEPFTPDGKSIEIALEEYNKKPL